ncbi:MULTISPECIES: RICIN domain-containing protein [unclassified Pedobacter]|uniref:RICIN domain-containing protein n=1 Tax=unclassified Pedobacter TaxID=2628915 RepID=UPI0014212FA0|nr:MULTISPECIES: RICIN domain-containing protein [unclassified Pedobacter]NII81132.1 hypothetical protein [Pedobacter sp. SG908]NMN35149.1 hypothetical protein [Pedobacter sp. SG918]
MKTNYWLKLYVALLAILMLSCKRETPVDKGVGANARAVTAIRTFYVSSSTGNDNNTGRTPDDPFKSVKKISGMTFSPGDAILFKAGDTWSGDTVLLRPKGSGTVSNPIVIDRYGTGPAPILSITQFQNTTGGVFGVVMLSNQSNWQINNLSIIANNANPLSYSGDNTSHASISGIYVKNSPSSAMQSNISITHCAVKSFRNNNNIYTQAVLGIGFEGSFTNIVVDSNTIDSCLAGIHSNTHLHFINPSNPNYASTNITFKNNLLRDVWGNGIVIGSITNGLIERNRVIRTSWGNGACIWLTHSTNSIVQYNEVSDQSGGSQDGTAFDDDDDEGASNGDIFQYNYSHNNAHGFMLLMPAANNVTVRYNISVNDGGSSGVTKRLFALSPSNNNGLKIYNNIFYIGQGISTRILGSYGGSSSGWAIKFYNNIFFLDGGSLTAFSEAPISQSSEFKNNCFYPAASFSSATNYFSPQVNAITSNPLFAAGSNFGATLLNAAGNNVDFAAAIAAFKLQAASPCINNGFSFANNATLDFANTNITGQTPTVGAIWPVGVTAPSYYVIINRNTGKLINLQNNTGKVECTQISADSTSAQWSQELHNGYTRFKNRKTGKYMEEENKLGYEEYNVLVAPDQWSCDFSLVANGSYTRLQNRYTGKLLNTQQNLGYVETTASLPTGYWSADWSIVKRP